MDRRKNVFQYFNKYAEETKERVEQGIERNRKGYFNIFIKDKEGNPIKNAKVGIKLTKHEFLHGANIFMLDEMENEEKNNTYKVAFAKTFNQATLPFYWSDLEPIEGKPRFAKDSPKVYRRPAPDLCLEYCQKNNITPKAHCLTYFNFHPSWINESDIYDVKKKLEKRYYECSKRYSDKIHGWEVINETLCNNIARDKQAFFKDPDLIQWNFRLAKKYFPNNELIINEASPFVWNRKHYAYNRSAYYQIINEQNKCDNLIDCIGMQFHIFCTPQQEADCYIDYYNPQNIFDVLDQYSNLNKPIQITEVTIPCYTDSAEDEDIQAKLIEQLYSIWFSHQAVEAITYWNLVDGYAAFAPQGDMKKGENFYRGGLMRFDLSKKPAYDMIKHLFYERWTTNLRTQTNNNGKTVFKGFYGDYIVTINNKQYNVTVNKNKKDIEVIL